MSTSSNPVPESPVPIQAVAPTPIPKTRSFYWCVRREFWEHRSLYIAPLAVVGLFQAGFLISLIHLPAKIRAASALEPMKQHEMIQQPYNFAALLLMATFIFVAFFYCLDALYGERRDRGILFWKSLPVSDLTTVLSKAIIPLFILPLFIFAITVVTQLIMLLLSSAVLVGSGQSFTMLWNHVPFLQMSVMLLYHLLAMHGLYYAPIYGWLLLVSCWARRAPFLWASLPLLAVGIVEKIAFNTSHFGLLLQYRFVGGPDAINYPAKATDPMQGMTMLPLGKFLVSSGLWIGLVVAAAFLAGAVRLRRNREPI